MTGYKSEMDGYDGILFLPNDNPRIPKFDIKFIKYIKEYLYKFSSKSITPGKLDKYHYNY